MEIKEYCCKFKIIKNCRKIYSVFGYLMTTQFPHVFDELTYNPLIGIWAEFMNISITFVWSFTDTFIMVISLCIATRFKQINNRLELVRGRVRVFNIWMDLIYWVVINVRLTDCAGKFLGGNSQQLCINVRSVGVCGWISSQFDTDSLFNWFIFHLPTDSEHFSVSTLVCFIWGLNAAENILYYANAIENTVCFIKY